MHIDTIFSARQHIAYMLSALYAIARPSVCPSVTRVNHTKTAEDRIMKFSPYGSPIHPSSLCGVSFIQKFQGVPPERERQARMTRDQPFVALCVNISKTVADTTKVTTDN